MGERTADPPKCFCCEKTLEVWEEMCIECDAARYATIALAKWLRAVAREAEVAGLVEDAADAFDEAVGAAETYEPHRVRTAAAVHRDALSRLARLAGGVA